MTNVKTTILDVLRAAAEKPCAVGGPWPYLGKLAPDAANHIDAGKVRDPDPSSTVVTVYAAACAVSRHRALGRSASWASPRGSCASACIGWAKTATDLRLCVSRSTSARDAENRARFLAIITGWAWVREPALAAVLEAYRRLERVAWGDDLG